jgi:hypothetical protein
MRLTVAIVALALLPGCGQVLVDEYPYASFDAGVPDAPIQWASAACASCTASSCDAERAACEGSSSCRPTLACVAKCPVDDLLCRFNCEEDLGSSSQFTALDNCRRTKCSGECIGKSISGVFESPGCGCIDVQCADQIPGCLTSPGARIGDCERKLACARRFGSSPDAIIRCVYENKDGEDALIAMRKCWTSTGCESCDVVGGHVLSCAFKYRWQAPTQKTASVTLTVTRYGAPTGVPGVRVRALLPGQCPLGGAAVDEGVTGPDGKVTLGKVPIQPRGFEGCFELTSPLHLPSVFYTGHPITRDENQMSGSVATPDDAALVAALAGVPIEEGTAVIGAGAHDCLFTRASGVGIDIDADAKLPSTVRVYADPLPNPRLEVTTAHGSAGFINVKPGYVTLSMHFNGRLVASERIYARPDHLTGMILLPSAKD